MKRLLYEDVKEYIERFGYQLVSEKYKNNYTKLDLICPEGHHHEMSYSNFCHGEKRCPFCNPGFQRHSYEYIKKYIEINGYQLVSKKYKNNYTKLDLICPEGHKFEMRYNCFQKGKRCPECVKHMVISKGEKEVLNFVQSIYGGKIIENDRSQVINPLTGKYLELDIWLPEINKAIEYNGVYWHSKKDIKYKDNEKQIQCQEKKIDLLIVEEEKWINYKTFLMQRIEDFIINICS